MSNIVKNNMSFTSFKDAANYIGYTKSNCSSLIKKALSHYCEYEVLKDKSIIVLKAFENVIPFINNDYTHEIGDVLSNKFGSFEVIDRFIEPKAKGYSTGRRVYKMRCYNDGTEFVLTNQMIKNGSGCPICGRRKIIPGQSLYDLHPELLKYLVNPEDAKHFSSGSGKKIKCRCPECGNEKDIAVSSLVKHGFSCSYCSDGISYPNKFIWNMLDQLGINHKREAMFDWLPKKYYDEYLLDYNMIIENHGGFHYLEKDIIKKSNKTLDDITDNDQYKKKAAQENGIEHYIILDCRFSEMSWIKKSVMNSKLPSLLNFNEKDVDWEKCNEFACSSIMYEVWEDWNKCKDVEELSKKYNVSNTTIRTYIHNGEKCGRCEPYIYQRVKHTDGQRGYYARVFLKPIHCLDDDVYFSSRFDCEEYYKDFFPKKTGSYSLYKFINEGKPYKGKHFIYITQKEFNEVKIKSLTDNSIIAIGNLFDLDKEEK